MTPEQLEEVEPQELEDENEQPLLMCNACGGAEPGWRARVCPYCGEGVMDVWDND